MRDGSSQLSALRPTMAMRPAFAAARPRFGSAAEAQALKAAVKVGQEAVADVSHIGAAERLQKAFSRGIFAKDVRVGGMSLEDMAARLQTLIGVYILQGIFAAKGDNFWETNGRNAIVWTMTTFLTQFLKNDTFGVNTLLLNPFLRKKVTDPAALKELNPVTRMLVNPMRMQMDYVDILEGAGLIDREKDKDLIAKAIGGKKSVWASLDINKLDKVNQYFERLDAERSAENLPQHLRELISKTPEELKTMLEGLRQLPKAEQNHQLITRVADELNFRALPGFLRRVNAFPLISTGLITAATVYLIGNVSMKIVYKTFARLDKKPKSGGASQGEQGKGASSASTAVPKRLSVTPHTFGAFTTGTAYQHGYVFADGTSTLTPNGAPASGGQPNA